MQHTLTISLLLYFWNAHTVEITLWHLYESPFIHEPTKFLFSSDVRWCDDVIYSNFLELIFSGFWVEINDSKKLQPYKSEKQVGRTFLILRGSYHGILHLMVWLIDPNTKPDNHHYINEYNKFMHISFMQNFSSKFMQFI